MHASTQVSSVSFGNSGDHLRGPGQTQRGCKAANDDNDFPLKPQGLQGFIDRTLVEALPRDADVPPGCKPGGRNPAFA